MVAEKLRDLTVESEDNSHNRQPALEGGQRGHIPQNMFKCTKVRVINA